MSVGHTCPTITLEIDTLLIYSKQEVMFNLRLYTSIFGTKICTINVYTFVVLDKIVQPYLLIVKNGGFNK